ncbi:DUF58 domain-containing protein [Neptuniibacter halophilus]|uniref:DUF58 domain-containing protein n=1 Tax=Neptuniibacter halophilus TaxID=651666 RepID=UPI002572824C|nr:DUF58 domain-containing protein [Neptuniibacter halophilus]
MLTGLITPLREVVNRWAASRRPSGRSILLNQKRIFIFPSAAGWAYLLLIVVLFLIAVNYQNNLIYGVSFMLVALGILTIHYTFLNLSGLRVQVLRGENCYAGDMAEFYLSLDSDNQRHYESIRLNWQGQPAEQVYLSKGSSQQVMLNVKARQRGILRPGLLRIETRYPFGLVCAWSWLEPDISALVFPKPHPGRVPQSQGGDGEGELGNDSSGEDFSGLDEYQPGISSRHIAWKQYAQGRGLLIKRFLGQQSRKVWLNWESWPELATEQRLSVLCYWAIQLEHEGVEYGVLLPGQKILPARGPQQLERVLTAAALFPGGAGRDQ